SVCTRSGEASTPALRSTRANPSSTSLTSRRLTPVTSGHADDGVERHLAHAVAVLLVLQHRAERRCGQVGVQLTRAERVQGTGPVDRLGDAGRLQQVELAELAGGVRD